MSLSALCPTCSRKLTVKLVKRELFRFLNAERLPTALAAGARKIRAMLGVYELSRLRRRSRLMPCAIERAIEPSLPVPRIVCRRPLVLFMQGPQVMHERRRRRVVRGRHGNDFEHQVVGPLSDVERACLDRT